MGSAHSTVRRLVGKLTNNIVKLSECPIVWTSESVEVTIANAYAGAGIGFLDSVRGISGKIVLG